jgi:hypothetical protein
VRKGSTGAIGDIAACLARNGRRYQFSPCWTAADLLSAERSRGLSPEDFLIAVAGERVIGCAALWDQRAFKQIVVRGYAAAMRWRRASLDVAARVLRTPRLPDPGQPLAHVYLSHVAVDDDDPDVFRALFDAAYEDARQRGQTCLIAGFAERHPFLRILRRRYTAWSYTSVLYAVQWDADAGAVSLDGRIPHLEVGLL